MNCSGCGAPPDMQCLADCSMQAAVRMGLGDALTRVAERKRKGDQKIKTASAKVPLQMVPLRALKGAARVFGFGARKYSAGNYISAEDLDVINRYVGGLLRHIAETQGLDGLYHMENYVPHLDEESGLPELDHAICGLIMLRAILTSRGLLPEDPGVGNEPPGAK